MLSSVFFHAVISLVGDWSVTELRLEGARESPYLRQVNF